MSTPIAHRNSLVPASAVIRRRGIALAIAVSATLLASGCGSGGGDDGKSTDSAAAGTDSLPASNTATESQSNGGSEEGGCDLISDEVAASVLGVDIVRREPDEDPTTGGVSCTKGNELGTFVNISVTPGAGPTFLDQAIGEAGYEPVPGVGDRAVFLTNGGSLLIAVGADLVTVQVDRGGVPGSLGDCLTVAEDVLSNL